MATTKLMVELFLLLGATLNFYAAAAQPLGQPLTVEGRVYCDLCRAGARVRIECRDRKTHEIVYTIQGITDSTGTYKINIDEDHHDEICDATLVGSPRGDCMEADPGRDRARVILTHHNGMVSTRRFANAMGFLRFEPFAGCRQVLSQFELED